MNTDPRLSVFICVHLWLRSPLCFDCLPPENLIGDDTDQDHGAHHREIQRRRNAKQVDEVLQDLQQRRAGQNPDDRTLAAAQAATAQNGRGNAVQLEEIAV